MKKSLICMLLLAVLSAAGLGMAHSALSAAADQVEVYPQTILGDPSAAQGLDLRFRSEMDKNLYWNTQLDWGGAPETEMEFYPQGYRYQGEDRYQLTINRLDGYGISSNMDLQLEEGGEEVFDQDSPLTALLMELADRTGAGEEQKQEYTAEEFDGCIPMDVNFTFPWMELSERDSWTTQSAGLQQLREDLRRAFSFRLPEGAAISLTAKKNEQGQLIEAGYDMLGSWAGWKDFSIASASAQARDYGYFVVTAWDDEEDALMDYSQTPEGYGLYRFPARKDVTIEDLEMVLPLDPACRVNEMQADKAQEKLLMLVEEAGARYLWVVDGATAEREQVLPLPPAQKEDSWWAVSYVDEDYILLLADSDYLVLPKDERGMYDLDFVIPFSQWNSEEYAELQKGAFYSSEYFAFDGARLAMAAVGNYHEKRSGLYLLVCDAQGLQYAGYVDSSLGIGNQSERAWWCCRLDNWDEDTIRLNWT